MAEEYMIRKIREWARNGVINHDYEVDRLVAYGVPLESALIMAAEDTLTEAKP
uniref:Uncharacterized protein n=1 Tax=viral metagenome TaxID=1070528 RepID=A0A6H2A268_9ZZZZ